MPLEPKNLVTNERNEEVDIVLTCSILVDIQRMLEDAEHKIASEYIEKARHELLRISRKKKSESPKNCRQTLMDSFLLPKSNDTSFENRLGMNVLSIEEVRLSSVDMVDLTLMDTHTITDNLLANVAQPTEKDLSSMSCYGVRLDDTIVNCFLTIVASQTNGILFERFLFDLIEIDKGWTNFLMQRSHGTHYAPFIDALENRTVSTIVPICRHDHWVSIVRKHDGLKWVIYYLDSIEAGSRQRMKRYSEALRDSPFCPIHNEDVEWVAAPIVLQSELECGARACLHGILFALSDASSDGIMKHLQQEVNLGSLSRQLVVSTCRTQSWVTPGWLKGLL